MPSVSRWAVLVLLLPAAAAAQPLSVRVRAETRIELRVAPRGADVEVGATLRDDLGQPLAAQRVEIRILDEARHTEHGRATRSTDAQGAIDVRFEALTGEQYLITARYEGDERYQRIEVQQRLDLARAHVRLTVGVGAGGRLDLDQREHAIDVRAASDRGGAGLALVVSNELGEMLAQATTGADEHARFVIPSERLGPPAAGRIIVRTEGDRVRAGAQTEVPVVRFRPSRIELRARSLRIAPGDRAQIEGRLSDSTGPMARRAVGIFASETHLATVLSDDQGRFERAIELEAAEDRTIEISARYVSDAPWRTSVRSAPLSIRIEGRGSTPWPWLLVPMAICAIAIGVLSRRARTVRTGTRVERPSAAPPGVAPAKASSRAQRSDVAGTVLDADEGTPLEGARVTLSSSARTIERETDEHGRFDAGEVAGDRWQLRVEKGGYEHASAEVRVPHRGQWSDATVRLSNLRQAALRRYRPVAEALAPSRKWWAFWTPRELLDRADPPKPPDLVPLTNAVERAAYADPGPTADDVVEIGRRAERVAQALERDPEPRVRR